MKNEFSGTVSGIYKFDDCILCRYKKANSFSGIFTDADIMRNYYGGEECVVIPACAEKETLEAARRTGCAVDTVCPCAVIRLFGIGLAGGGVLCKALRCLSGASVFPLGTSISECGLTFAVRSADAEAAWRLLCGFVDRSE